MRSFRRAGQEKPNPAGARERAALDIHDNIVQGLAEAKLAFEIGRPEQALAAVERTLAQARRIVTELMGEAAPGDLRRATPADQPFGDR